MLQAKNIGSQQWWIKQLGSWSRSGTTFFIEVNWPMELVQIVLLVIFFLTDLLKCENSMDADEFAAIFTPKSVSTPYEGILNFDYGRCRGCDWWAEDTYSSAAPDPTFAFVGGLCCPTLDFVITFIIMTTFYSLLTSLFCISISQNVGFVCIRNNTKYMLVNISQVPRD
jgi:hypothetical protein